MSGQKIWSGRFSSGTGSLMEAYSTSIHVDKVLFDADIRVNKAWASALGRIGVYNADQVQQVRDALDAIAVDYEQGKLEFSPADEDIHSANERWLTARLGDIGARIHTGRSRNDQVITDLKIYLRERVSELDEAVKSLQAVLIDLADDHREIIFPGQTHLRQAQPVSFAHYILALFFQLQRNRERLRDYRIRMNKMPLGSGAIAGAAFDIDRVQLADELGFDAPTENSYDATADRDFVLELLYICGQIMQHLSRLSEDFIIWSCEPFAWLEVGEAYSTGSSMMPQKKNPDSLELVRGKSARVIGNLTTGMTLLKGVPTAYVRDLQEDKEPVFDSLNQTLQSILIVKGVFETLTVNRQKMLRALDPALYATDLADYLVKKGVAFRNAHSIVGSVVAHVEKKSMTLDTLPLDHYRLFSDKFDEDIYDLFNPVSSVSKRNLAGGTGPESIASQLEMARDLLH